MTRFFLIPLLMRLLAAGIALYAPSAGATPDEFSFGVIAYSSKATPGEALLREAIAETDADNLAFVVTSGIKAAGEPCSDALYNRRRNLLESAKNGLIVSLSAADWADCKNENGKSAAIGRLGRLRDMFFTDEFSLGGSRIPLVRQSATAKFRSYPENARWEFGGVMFVTINLPDNNNNYLPEAGRNSEFEDRLIANRDWLRRIFTYAARRKLSGIVLFCDGDPVSKPSRSGSGRDGFAETRRQLATLVTDFPGRVLVVHGHSRSATAPSNGIVWQGNLGLAKALGPWMKFTVNPSLPMLFAVADRSAEPKNTGQ